VERSIYKWLLLPTVVLYWLVCFAPFDWVTPVAYVQNDAYLSTPSPNSDRGPSGSPDRPRTLHLGGTGLARFDLKNPDEANLAPAQLHLSLNVQCEHSEQFGPARIATLSDTTSARNFMLGQEGTALVLRWLRPDSNNNGLPEFVINDFFAACKPRQLTIVAVGGGLRVTSDGHTLLNLPAPSSSMQRWITDYPLLLGNEASWNRGWAGQIWALDLQIDNRKISQDWKNIQTVVAAHGEPAANNLVTVQQSKLTITAGQRSECTWLFAVWCVACVCFCRSAQFLAGRRNRCAIKFVY